jgi:hypothetical protein
MLKAKGEIMFTLAGGNYTAGDHFRVAFSFGDGLLYSGTIKSDNDEYNQGRTYSVDIEFFTVEDDAYKLLKPVLADEINTVMCAGSKILGVAKLTDFYYEVRVSSIPA